MALEILKAYIETHPKTGFIQPSKSFAGVLIFFNIKSDGKFHLCIDYWGLNNLPIKNQYLLPLIDEFLDQLSQAKQFI